MTPRIRTAFLATSAGLALTLTLSACGGGGDAPPGVTVPSGIRSVSASAGSDVNATTYTSLGSDVGRALVSSAGAGGLVGAASSDDRARALSTTTGENVAAGGPGWWVALSQRLVAAGAASQRARIQAVQTQPFTCDSGSGSITANDADNNGQLSAGDSLTLTVNACVIGGEPAVSGSFSLSLDAVQLNGDKPVAFQATLSATALTVAGYGSMNGAATVWIRGLDTNIPTARVSYQGTQFTIGTHTVRYDLDVYSHFSGSTEVYQYSGGLTVDGQTYAIVPVVDFVGSPPTVGSLAMRDAAGDTVRLVAGNATSFQLQYFPVGTPDTGTPAASTTLTWASLGN